MLIVNEVIKPSNPIMALTHTHTHAHTHTHTHTHTGQHEMKSRKNPFIPFGFDGLTKTPVYCR